MGSVSPFRNLLILSILVLLSSMAAAQHVHGVVRDGDKLPVAGAYIIKKNTTIHAHSNETGAFLINNVTAGDTLVISFLGYEKATIILTPSDLSQKVVVTLRESPFDLRQVVVSSRVNALERLSDIDLYANPVNSSQEILQKVPGLFIAQHAGGGKAEQIFLRGFDIDHGTDINITVDGLPVNMVSHAHGQGYADLHFLIPETVDRIDFGKGPYFTDKGNFTTAGYVGFQTKERLDQSLVSLEAGRFNTLRFLGMVDLLPSQENRHAYIAAEHLLSDGPFESPQNFGRTNLMGKYTMNLNGQDKLSVALSHFQSKWDASGQIPQRAVDSGLITRFGAIDDTEGGQTSRTNIGLTYLKGLNDGGFIRNRFYFVNYEFELFSNFTFFLNNPEDGDQIRQYEDRRILGWESVLQQSVALNDVDLGWQAGLGLRFDEVQNNELSRTLNRRTTLEQLSLGDVNETNVFGFLNAELEWKKWLFNPGVRLDFFKFDYTDALLPRYQTLSESKAIFSPKFNIIYNHRNNLQFYLKSGIGFHSNDTRVVVANQGQSILPAAFGTDFGLEWKPLPRLWVHSALWHLFLEQEFVYVGDEAVVEPSGKSRRLGADLGLRYQITDYLFFDADVNYTLARAIEEPADADYIPLAPDLTATGGWSFRHPNGWAGGLRFRYIKDRAANENKSIIAEGYFIADLNAQYTFKHTTFGFSIENLFDTEWNEAQFATESRLRNEPVPVEELHFTPGTPFFLKGQVSYRF